MLYLPADFYKLFHLHMVMIYHKKHSNPGLISAWPTYKLHLTVNCDIAVCPRQVGLI